MIASEPFSPIGLSFLNCRITVRVQSLSNDSASDRLRSWSRKPVGSARAGSNPVAVDLGIPPDRAQICICVSVGMASVRHCVRVVKEVDWKSTGLCPREFESLRCRILFQRALFTTGDSNIESASVTSHHPLCFSTVSLCVCSFLHWIRANSQLIYRWPL